MENVRKGKGVTQEEIEEMRKHGVPNWFIESCQKIKYMFPKAHAVAYVIMAFQLLILKFIIQKPFMLLTLPLEQMTLIWILY